MAYIKNHVQSLSHALGEYGNLVACLGIRKKIRYHEAVSKVTINKDLLNIKRHFAGSEASAVYFPCLRLHIKKLQFLIELKSRTPHTWI